MIHPEIKKFWEDSGYLIKENIIYFKDLNSSYLRWDEYECDHLHRYDAYLNNKVFVVALIKIYTIDDIIKYYWLSNNSNSISEEMMLRLIKLKYFL